MHFNRIHRSSERLLSTVHRGTAFEKRASSLLMEHMSMSLTRVGGSYDGGVDLIGWWWLPSGQPSTCADWSIANRRRLRILAQCKAEKRKVGPAYLRELEGVVYKHVATAALESPSSHIPQATISTPTEPPPVAVLVSESPFTRNCLLAAHTSLLPFLLVHLPPSGPGPLGAVFGNPALVSERGLLRGELEIRWERDAAMAGNGRPGLWWQGHPLPNWTPDSGVGTTPLIQPSL
ncbi:hypothetical protein B0F90DRAFT_1625287 [Multifurca ochricompacta]|uniref:Uncharacterized protein n=1 Tax=Multifurca ochricompacta TaxID=376703 RepID=A0AAD4M8R6_9AGAM|nr:hypothetical protein B0F90DRAFT_1625287 [Multifurca ochricompacta]